MGQPRRYAGPLIFINKTTVPAPHNLIPARSRARLRLAPWRADAVPDDIAGSHGTQRAWRGSDRAGEPRSSMKHAVRPDGPNRRPPIVELIREQTTPCPREIPLALR
jgi:hypothetical protein